MEFFAHDIPLAISILFMVVMPIPVYLVARLAGHGCLSSQRTRIFLTVLGFYVVYLAYVFFLCFKGVFATPALPPRILVFSTIPLLVFLMIIVFNLRITKNLLTKLSLSKLIRIHIFRLMGSFFIILYLLDALPRTFAMIAGIGDLVTALSSIYVAKMVAKKPQHSMMLVCVWNTFGLVDILATSATAFIFTKMSIESGILGVDVLATFPFSFIPAFAPPTIIFLHFLTYRKLLIIQKG